MSPACGAVIQLKQDVSPEWNYLLFRIAFAIAGKYSPTVGKPVFVGAAQHPTLTQGHIMLRISMGVPEMKITEVVADAHHLRVHIATHKDGIMAALLRLMGINATATLHGDAHGCSIERTSFSGYSRSYAPWHQVSATTHSNARNPAYLGAAITLLLFGVSMFFAGKSGPRNSGPPPEIGLVIIALAFVGFLLFLFKRSVMIGIVTTGGTGDGLKVKGSLADLARVKEASNLMEAIVRSTALGNVDAARSAGQGQDVATPSTPTAAGPTGAEANVATCPQCGARIRVQGGRTGRTITCPKCATMFN